MSRLLRYGLNALAVMSLLLCVAACVLWARSFFRAGAADRWSAFVPARAARYTFESELGRVTLLGPPAAPAAARPLPPPPAPKVWEVFNDPMPRIGLMPLPPDATAEGVVADVRNEQIAWDVSRRTRLFFKPVSR